MAMTKMGKELEQKELSKVDLVKKQDNQKNFIGSLLGTINKHKKAGCSVAPEKKKSPAPNFAKKAYALTKTGQRVKEAYVTGVQPDRELRNLRHYSQNDQVEQLRNVHGRKAKESRTPWGRAVGTGGGIGAVLGGATGAAMSRGGGLRQKLMAAGIGAGVGALGGAAVGAGAKIEDDDELRNSKQITNASGTSQMNDYRVRALAKQEAMGRLRQRQENMQDYDRMARYR